MSAAAGNMSNAATTLSTELGKLANLQPFQQGQQIINLLQNLTQGINRLETKMIAMDENNQIRFANIQVQSPSDQLQHLVNVNTGILVANFPDTADIPDRLTSQQIDPILIELGVQNPQGAIGQKHMQLRRQAGLRQRAV